MEKTCPSTNIKENDYDYIYNPKIGRWVLLSKIAKSLQKMRHQNCEV